MVAETDRTEAQLRMEKVRAGRGKSPQEPPMDPQEVRTMTEEEAFLMEQLKEVHTMETYAADDPSLPTAVVLHKLSGRVRMWKPIGRGQYSPRTISPGNRMMALAQGWKITCPQCHTNHEEGDLEPQDPNACPARKPIPVTECIVCGKRIFDNLVSEVPGQGVKKKGKKRDGDAYVELENTTSSTPEQRLLHGFHLHMWFAHPQQAAMRGLPRIIQGLPMDAPDPGRPL